jgi:lipoic acid synthetase
MQQRKPEWLNKKIDYKAMQEMGQMLRALNLHTVCEGARCPNMGECFRAKTATFMILGDVCTRNCRFCAVHKGKPDMVDIEEPQNLAEAAKTLALKHVVITSVTRDDLYDGGAGQFAACLNELRNELPNATTEVLIPDFKGDENAIQIVIDAKPNIINHNVETVPSLYPKVRPMAKYQRSLDVLNYVKMKNPNIYTKSGIMVGLGETEEEVLNLCKDLRAVNCDMLTIGQYLQPSKQHLDVVEYISPEQFKRYKTLALELGFKYVASDAYVRSSFNAANDFSAVLQ